MSPSGGRQRRAPGCRYHCSNGHLTTPSFASEADVPELWDCPRCGLPAGRDTENPPAPPRTEPYKTHLAYVKERRSDADGAAILEEALGRLRASRELYGGSGSSTRLGSAAARSGERVDRPGRGAVRGLHGKALTDPVLQAAEHLLDTQPALRERQRGPVAPLQPGPQQ